MAKDGKVTTHHPVEPLPNTLAQIYTHVHPMVVLSTFLLRFNSLVADPVSTLLSTALPLAVLQTAYVAICLPSANDAERRPKGKKGAGGKKVEEMGWGFKIVPALLSLILSTTLAAPLLGFTLLLFGAPLTSSQPHTLLCALHISLLSALPLIYVNGVDGDKWRLLLGLDVAVDEVFGAALGALGGAWVGAVPIPLDWDREWQRFPVTIVVGAYFGWALGKVVGGLVLRGRRIRMN
ncbi:hypothetical protein MBLNU457_6909t1 [Dothideomycetes sp. NU457]